MLLKKYITITVLVLMADDAMSFNNTDINELRKSFFRFQNQLWNHFTKKATSREPSYSDPQDYLLSSIHNFSVEIKKAQPKIYGLDDFKILPSYRKISNYINIIEKSFDAFNSIQNSKKSKRAVSDILQNKHNIDKVIQELGKTVSQNYFVKIIKETEKYHCILEQSQQQILYNIHRTIAITELKAYSIMDLNDVSSTLKNTEDVTEKRANEKYQIDTKKLDNSLLQVLKNTSPELWKCDPKSHRENETYIEVTKLLEGYFINKEDLEPSDKCKKGCNDYTSSKNVKCNQAGFCKGQKPCAGNLINCKSVPSDFEMCIGTDRRIEYADFYVKPKFHEYYRKYGKNMGCTGEKRFAESHHHKSVGTLCDFCFCLCDEESNKSDRFINLRPTLSNIRSNRVVTGIRFTKKNRIIHLQIQEGKLLPYGKIDISTVRWVPVDDYKIIDKHVKKGIDFHTFTNKEREIDLDTLKLDKNFVVTGVSFELFQSHINFKIYATPFNFESGELNKSPKRSSWTYRHVDNRKKINLVDPDIPNRIYQQTKPVKGENLYVQLQESDSDRDASQTTVPFFDAQPVVSSVATPLSGIGIYLKTRTFSGGFIAPKILTYDYYQRIVSY